MPTPTPAVEKEKTPENPFSGAEYQAFVDSMVPHCRCRSSDCPCDGVLAGGICDDIQDDEERDEE